MMNGWKSAVEEAEQRHGLRIGYGVYDRAGRFHEIVDLGVFDWVAQLTSNRRHRFVASAIGLQLLPVLFSGS
ncbi:hypothetical protein WJX64_06870 [Leifsonia sp. YIM 134122]|uniref:Uncharacterized protein n=1 Tax=Leifsonia stereocauli TaxID=3134136 RepID=A0ABU9W2N7_9MICO